MKKKGKITTLSLVFFVVIILSFFILQTKSIFSSSSEENQEFNTTAAQSESGGGGGKGYSKQLKQHEGLGEKPEKDVPEIQGQKLEDISPGSDGVNDSV